MIAEKYKIKKNSNKRQLHEILTLNKSKTNGTVKVIFITKRAHAQYTIAYLTKLKSSFIYLYFRTPKLDAEDS